MRAARLILATMMATVAAIAACGPPAEARRQRPPPTAPQAAVPLPVPRPALPGDAPSPPEKPTPSDALPQAPSRPAEATPAPQPVPEGGPPSPAAGPGCLDRLRARGVAAETAEPGPQPDPRCTVAEPVRLSSIRTPDGTEVELPDRPIVACAMAETFADFVIGLAAPLTQGTYGSPVAAIATGPGLECRPRNRVAGAKLSAHGNGLALDIERLTLKSGRAVLVGRPSDEADRRFDRAMRAAGCGYFNTELGPGSDAYHATHWHFDVLPRGSRGTSKFCE